MPLFVGLAYQGGGVQIDVIGMTVVWRCNPRSCKIFAIIAHDSSLKHGNQQYQYATLGDFLKTYTFQQRGMTFFPSSFPLELLMFMSLKRPCIPNMPQTIF